jgi:hypothetical protein
MRHFEPISIPRPGDGADTRHEHVWIVFSTALREVCLMVECPECGAFGTVDDPTLEEWSAAFYAPETPYRWHDDARVTVRR